MMAAPVRFGEPERPATDCKVRTDTVGEHARYLHADLTSVIIGAFYDVYNELGPGFLECVYLKAMLILLEEAGLSCRAQAPLSVQFRGRNVGEFRCDILVEDKVIVEIKTARLIHPAYEAQLLHYLKASGKQVGLLLNFGSRPVVRRMVL